MNEEDRRLLEPAAKAAGITAMWEEEKTQSFLRHVDGGLWTEWNPLSDNDDAFELGAKLRLNQLWQHDWLMVYQGDISVREYDLSDTEAAVRRAIVRFAAEIGNGQRPFPTADEIRKLVDPINDGSGYNNEFDEGA